jgi:hypothetical protein
VFDKRVLRMIFLFNSHKYRKTILLTVRTDFFMVYFVMTQRYAAFQEHWLGSACSSVPQLVKMLNGPRSVL